MKVLFIDIETTPALAWVWGLFKQNVGLNQIEQPTRMLCFAAKFKGDRKIHFHREHPNDPCPETDRFEMIQAAWNLLDEADVVVHYNGRSFDEKHLNREFLEAGLGPPSPFQSLDLLLVTRSSFRFLSNKLAHVSEELELAGKVPHEGFDLWTKCMAGDVKAWRVMTKYNKRDTTLLEDLYTRLLPWIKSHPSVALFDGDDGSCPRCNHPEVIKRGFYTTKVSKYQQYQCKGCGGYFRGKKRIAGADGRAV